MPKPDLARPYTQRDVHNMLTGLLSHGDFGWIRDPEGNPAVQAYGSSHLPSQPVYVYFSPSLVKMRLHFTPRRIAMAREEELWRAAEAARAPLRASGISSRRQSGSTQETERDEQWVLTVPERISEAGLAALEAFVALAASCMGVTGLED